MSNYSIDPEQLAEMFKALGNPHRLAMFQRLSRCCAPGTVCDVDIAAHQSVSELGEDMDIAPSTLSHHLKELNRAGLIQMRRDGKSVKCWVDATTLKALGDFFDKPLTSHHEQENRR